MNKELQATLQLFHSFFPARAHAIYAPRLDILRLDCASHAELMRMVLN